MVGACPIPSHCVFLSRPLKGHPIYGQRSHVSTAFFHFLIFNYSPCHTLSWAWAGECLLLKEVTPASPHGVTSRQLCFFYL